MKMLLTISLLSLVIPTISFAGIEIDNTPLTQISQKQYDQYSDLIKNLEIISESRRGIANLQYPDGIPSQLAKLVDAYNNNPDGTFANFYTRGILKAYADTQKEETAIANLVVISAESEKFPGRGKEDSCDSSHPDSAASRIKNFIKQIKAEHPNIDCSYLGFVFTVDYGSFFNDSNSCEMSDYYLCNADSLKTSTQRLSSKARAGFAAH